MGRGHHPSREALCAAIAAALVGVVPSSAARGQAILFDASKAEMAGNADWVVDADLNNLGVNSSHLMQVGSGNESNPQAVPTPAQSGINAGTSESYWKGAISAWGVAMAKRGATVQSLPYNGAITWGNGSNAQDLSNYKVFVVPEPNIVFSASEKTAILNFVNAGGGLFMVSDHNGSDRNGDGVDSPTIWNGLMTGNPFGIQFNLDDQVVTSTNVDSASSDALVTGVAGNAISLAYHNGATMTISTAVNPTVRAAVWQVANDNTTVMMASARYGAGRVVALGDSSPADDGTGDTHDGLFFGWDEASDGTLITNGTAWLAAGGLAQVWKGSANANWEGALNWPALDKPLASEDVTFPSPVPATGSTITLATGESAKSLTFNESYTLSSGGIALSTGNVTVAAGKTVVIASAFSTPSTLTKSGAGALQLTGISTAAVNVAAGILRVAAHGASPANASVAPSLTINDAGGAKLDLTDNALITSAAVGTFDGSLYTGVTGWIASGRNGTAWDGAGMITSMSAAQNSNFTTLAVARASDVRPATATATALWSGRTITGTDTLVIYTYGGDANLDGKINIDDYVRIDSGIAGNLSGWSNGDFNYDGKVNIDDYTTVIDANIGNQNGFVFPTVGGIADGGGRVVAVPEPGCLIAASLGLGFVRVGRRRRRARP